MMVGSLIYLKGHVTAWIVWYQPSSLLFFVVAMVHSDGIAWCSWCNGDGFADKSIGEDAAGKLDVVSMTCRHKMRM